MMSNSEITGISRRIKGAIDHFKEIGDDLYEDTVRELVEKMCEYTSSVFDDKFKTLTREEYIQEHGAAEYRSRAEELDRKRKICHDSLIIQIRMVDMICRENGIKEIYGDLPEEYKEDTDGLMGEANRSRPGVVETRHAIADWTFDFVIGCAIMDCLDIDDYRENGASFNKIANSFGRIGSKGVQERVNKIVELS